MYIIDKQRTYVKQYKTTTGPTGIPFLPEAFAPDFLSFSMKVVWTTNYKKTSRKEQFKYEEVVHSQ